MHICSTQLPGTRQSVEYQGVEFKGAKLTTVAKYRTHLINMKCPPMTCPASEGIPLLATSAIIIPSESQAILDSQIS
ncbi:hypothetical protein DSO57_1028515 [Entomophthora muscae]|uniref:Uncharacterized protein n=1 Tax=Entomophthora muscae TaxID=34485 RepID=A0ACC2SES4_9FUNG|nr:hypothetical protein DSO57_1028515 [Entomophthora muscae]